MLRTFVQLVTSVGIGLAGLWFVPRVATEEAVFRLGGVNCDVDGLSTIACNLLFGENCPGTTDAGLVYPGQMHHYITVVAQQDVYCTGADCTAPQDDYNLSNNCTPSY